MKVVAKPKLTKEEEEIYKEIKDYGPLLWWIKLGHPWTKHYKIPIFSMIEKGVLQINNPPKRNDIPYDATEIELIIHL